ncbi:putative integral membrane protein-1 [Elsinoe australis]|uniref:Putative integral membrane protein-1 n=1 Tax=Elsinoe australis TaxID=40998 RepID=A0A4U7B8X6_9PEZI|nr:putative integral membrane protein-1 [Elsinoe australis]
MALKRRQIAIIVSVIWLGILTVIAAYALNSSSKYSLPIPNALSALTLALPSVAGITIEISNAFATALAPSPKHRKTDTSTIPPVLLPGTITLALLLIYETVIGTLAGTRISPIDGLNCALREKWQELYHDRNADRVKKIQDAFRCCGFSGARDMAWPFDSPDACQLNYRSERASGCLNGWRGEERTVGALMLVVAIGTFVWMVAVVATPVAQPKPLRQILQIAPVDGDEEERNAYSRYRDQLDEEDDEGDETSIRREITNLNSQSNLASLVEGNRSRPSVYVNDQDRQDRWRND